MRKPSSPAISIRSAVSESRRAISRFSKWIPQSNCIGWYSVFLAARNIHASVRLTAAALLLAALPLRSQIPPIIAVSAATYQTTLAPDSVGSVFGVNLVNDTATADVRVDVAGQPASLLYVSPTQINFVVPGEVARGATTV